MSNTVVTIGAPSGQTQVSVSSADIIYVSVAAGFTGQGGGGGGGGDTNLTTTRTATTVTINSSTGTDATIAAADGTNAGVMTAAMQSKLAGIEENADVTDAANVGSVLNAATSKTTPVDADTLPLSDSAADGGLKKLSWANLKATAKAYFDTLYAAVVHTHVISDVTNLQTTLDGKVDENAAITGATKTKITYDAKGLVTAGADAAIADITGLQTALDGKVDENAAITGATKTKITYDAKGLVTAGADATTADIADSSNKRYVTDAQLTVIGNTSGTNTGDQNLFSTIAVSGQSNVVADTTGDTLTLVAGSNITITTDASTDSITIASTGGGGGGSGTDWGDITGTLSDQTDLQTALDGKVDENAAITGATKTKITYDAKGLVTAGADAAIADITGLQTALDGKITAFADPNADRIVFWDDSAGAFAALEVGSGLSISGTTLSATGGSGAVTLDATNTQTGPANTTTETAIYSFALPTDLVAGDMVQLNLTGLYKNNSGAARTVYMYWKLGATTLMEHDISIPANAAERIGNMVFTMFVGASNTQKFGLYSMSSDAPANDANLIQAGSRFFNSIGYASSSEDLSTSKTLQVTVKFLLANADLYCYSQAARLVKYPAP